MAIIVTPEQIAWDVDALARDFARLGSAIETSRDLPPAFVDAWRSFHQGWILFADEIDFWDRLWGGTAERVEEYRRELVAWEARFRELGGALAGPSVAAPPESGLGELKWIVFGVAAIVAVVYLAPLLPAVKLPAKVLP